MKILDVASPILLVVPLFFLVFSILIVFLEALVLRYIVKYETYRSAFLHSLLANTVSTLVGFMFIDRIEDSYLMLLILWAITVAIESIILLLINKKRDKRKLLLGSLLMNIASYLVLIVFINLS